MIPLQERLYAAKWLRITREDLGFSRRQAAGLAGLDYNAVYYAEEGVALTDETLSALCKAYGMTVESLLA